MKKALIIVDLQNDYFPGGNMELAGIEQATKNARAALDLFRAKKLPIFHIQHIMKRAGANYFLPETNGVEINKNLRPENGEPVIQKNFPNSFRDTSLNEHLQSLHIEEVVICGAMTHICIDTTVRAAFDLGFRCLLLFDACATRNLGFRGITVEASQVHAAFMAALSGVFAEVIETKELESRLESYNSR